MRNWVVLGVILGLALSHDALGLVDHFRAAVWDKAPFRPYIHPGVMTRQEALESVQEDLDTYEQQAGIAEDQGVQIIIYPEYGFYPMGTNREQMHPFLEPIPDPDSVSWNPCEGEPEIPHTEMLQRLSCMAKNHKIYVVANLGMREACDITTDPHCPDDGRYQYNTNVAFDPTGLLVARYRKKNLFFESRYDEPMETDLTVFDTPFGRMGTFVCFDVLFHEPSISVIEQKDVDTVVFPTAWMNVLPYFSAVPFHQAFAIGMGVNFLSANIHFPPARFSGSGIYGSIETLAYRNDETSLQPYLLVADVESKPDKIYREDVHFSNFSDGKPEFTGEIFGDIFNFVRISGNEGRVEVCNGMVCCRLDYRRVPGTEERFVLGAFRGLHTEEGTYYIEVCAFIKCESTSPDSCGEATTSVTHFEHFELVGNFTTKYVFPMVVIDGIDPSSGQWRYDGKSISANSTEKPFISAVFFSRRYDLDDGEKSDMNSAEGCLKFGVFFITCVLINSILALIHV